jgi:hypothetical protein
MSIHTLFLAILAVAVLAPAAQKDERMKAIARLGISFESGDVLVYYSVSLQERARKFRDFLVKARDWYEQQLGVRRELTMPVVTQADWKRAPMPLPYPAAHMQVRPGKMNFMVIPGQYEDFQDLKPKGYPWDLYMESGICHEYGHLLASTLRVWAGTAWLDEWSAHLFVAAYQKHLGRKPLPPGEPERYTSLADLHNFGIDVGFRNYLWFYFHLWGLGADYIEAVGFINAVQRLQAEFPLEKQTRDSLPSRCLHAWSGCGPDFARLPGC